MRKLFGWSCLLVVGGSALVFDVECNGVVFVVSIMGEVEWQEKTA